MFFIFHKFIRPSVHYLLHFTNFLSKIYSQQIVQILNVIPIKILVSHTKFCGSTLLSTANTIPTHKHQNDA